MIKRHGQVPGLGARIRSWRLAKGLTLQQLADAAGTTKGYLSLIENRKSDPTATILLGISLALGASADWLLMGPRRARRWHHPDGRSWLTLGAATAAGMKKRELYREDEL